jgi:hypothetical protein
MNKKRKLPILSRLKKKAPRIPEFTCPDIDHIMEYVENLDLLKRGQLLYFKRRMEKLRSSNDSLRESGAYWYEEIKKILEK